MCKVADTLWLCNPTPRRATADWRAVIDYLAAEMAAFFGREVRVVDFWVNDEEGHASSSACSRVTIVLSEQLDLLLYGSMCISINHGEAVGISADLMFFCEGKRLGAHRLSKRHSDLVILVYERGADGQDRWRSCGFTIDEFGEWESLQQGPSVRDQE